MRWAPLCPTRAYSPLNLLLLHKGTKQWRPSPQSLRALGAGYSQPGRLWRLRAESILQIHKGSVDCGSEPSPETQGICFVMTQKSLLLICPLRMECLGNYFTACSSVGTYLQVQSPELQLRGYILHEKGFKTKWPVGKKACDSPYVCNLVLTQCVYLVSGWGKVRLDHQRY